MVLGEYEKVSRTEKILCCLKKKRKKKLSVGMLNMLKCVSHYLLHTIALWICFVYVCVVK